MPGGGDWVFGRASPRDGGEGSASCAGGFALDGSAVGVHVDGATGAAEACVAAGGVVDASDAVATVGRLRDVAIAALTLHTASAIATSEPMTTAGGDDRAGDEP